MQKEIWRAQLTFFLSCAVMSLIASYYQWANDYSDLALANINGAAGWACAFLVTLTQWERS